MGLDRAAGLKSLNLINNAIAHIHSLKPLAHNAALQQLLVAQNPITLRAEHVRHIAALVRRVYTTGLE